MKLIKDVRVHNRFGGDGGYWFVSLILEDAQTSYIRIFKTEEEADMFTQGLTEGLRLSNAGFTLDERGE